MRISPSGRVLALLFLSLTVCGKALCDDPTATMTGLVTDQSGRVVVGATVVLTNVNTNIPHTTRTNEVGVYRISDLPPGIYRANVTKDGFKSIVKGEIEFHVQDEVSINFTLQIGSVSETVTVEGGAPLINTESAAVSTVVDRQFAENLPMNGRSFQTLIELTPGVVLTPNNSYDGGEFSVNGQRASSNYWTVDGVSANIGTPAGGPGNGFAGSLGGFSAQGGTNSLVSVDALQEFRVLTSTYAPEYGRTPGGQISIVTRSGTNQYHGLGFDYFRNEALDANDWFANNFGLPRPEERQNDFGGTFGGPILKDRTFFFFSYEGLRLRLPEIVQSFVPDNTARANALPVMQPYLNAFPQPDPNLPDDIPDGIGQYNASFANRSTLDAYSLRVDHRIGEKLTLFGRYNYSPSAIIQRGTNGSLSQVSPDSITTQTFTMGATWVASPAVTDDVRFNYSHVLASSYSYLDGFGGAVPLTSLPLPGSISTTDGAFGITILSAGTGFSVGNTVRNVQRQINIVDTLSVQKGAHNLKFGVDYRRLSPIYTPSTYFQYVGFDNMPSTENGLYDFASVASSLPVTVLLRNLGVFAEDTWHLNTRFTLTYGLRWDVDFSPKSLNGPSLPAVTGYNLNDLSQLALAPPGTPPFQTRYGNVAPRLGAAYQLSQSADFGSVLRGGFGVFFDLATQEVGNNFTSDYPFGSSSLLLSGTFPLDSASAAPPPITPNELSNGQLSGFDPHLNLPYTLQWNFAFEQALGKQQTLTASYIGSAGRRLMQSFFISQPNASIGSADLVGNTATSNYNALQLQFERRLSHGLQILASYTWSHSIDDASAGSYGNTANTLVPTLDPNENRGPSDFDLRHSFSAAISYNIPAPRTNAFVNSILRGWSLQSIILAHSAPPLNVYYPGFSERFRNGFTQIRPDVVPGQPFYLTRADCINLYGAPCPGGLALNPAAFTTPPLDPNTGDPLRQGDLGRNALRGFGTTQWDFAIHREFPIRESMKLQFRAELFNVVNHPNFGPPLVYLGTPVFGLAYQMLGQALAAYTSSGSFNPLYQIGGPRSIQLALKLMF